MRLLILMVIMNNPGTTIKLINGKTFQVSDIKYGRETIEFTTQTGEKFSVKDRWVLEVTKDDQINPGGTHVKGPKKRVPLGDQIKVARQPEPVLITTKNLKKYGQTHQRPANSSIKVEKPSVNFNAEKVLEKQRKLNESFSTKIRALDSKSRILEKRIQALKRKLFFERALETREDLHQSLNKARQELKLIQAEINKVKLKAVKQGAKIRA